MKNKLYGALAALMLCALVFGSAQAASAANPVVVMVVANRGRVTIELYPKDAPKTVAHFLDLVKKKKFYNGILFHRVRPGFVAQAGDPQSRKFTAAQLVGKSDEELGMMNLGGGGSGHNIPFEENARTHETGTLSMALNAPRSASGDSQFFINLAPNHRLDGDYCVFGKVIKGMDVVKKIRQGDRIVSITEVKKK
jgi:peptidyl-prolyl cis-trans isomerase B (cyclophilin B)